jgi:hypothetical protein
MLKRSIFGALTALAIAGGSLAATTGTASAAQFGLYIGVPGPYYGPAYGPPAAPSCWRWSYYWNRYVWACGGPNYATPYFYGYYHHHHHHDYD